MPKKLGTENMDPNVALQRLMINSQANNLKAVTQPKPSKKVMKPRPQTAKVKQPASSYKQFIANQTVKATRANNQRI